MKNGKIIFLEVPPSLAEELKNYTAGNASLQIVWDPSIPLPLEIEAEEDSAINVKNLAEDLSWEMILAGMMRIISNPESAPESFKPGWLDYYRQFIFVLKPEIYSEFTGAAIIKARNKDFDAALEIIGILEGLLPHSPEVLLNKALIQEEEAVELEQKGSEMEAALLNDKALETYTRAMEIEPVLPEILFNLGFFHFRKKEFDKAREFLTDYLPLAEDPEKKEKAIKIIHEIQKSGLDDIKYTKSLELIRQGKEEEALLLIHDFLEEHPKVWNAWFVLGWALRKLKRWEDALASFGKALELGGNTADTRNETAICMMELGNLKGARKELEAALCEEPDNIKNNFQPGHTGP